MSTLAPKNVSNIVSEVINHSQVHSPVFNVLAKNRAQPATRPLQRRLLAPRQRTSSAPPCTQSPWTAMGQKRMMSFFADVLKSITPMGARLTLFRWMETLTLWKHPYLAPKLAQLLVATATVRFLPWILLLSAIFNNIGKKSFTQRVRFLTFIFQFVIQRILWAWKVWKLFMTKFTVGCDWNRRVYWKLRK